MRAFRTIRFEEPEVGIGLVTLDRPDRLNALNMEMVEDLDALFRELRLSEEVRVLVITGEGRGFCSGADLVDALQNQGQRAFTSPPLFLIDVQKKYADLILGMRRLPQPIISAVNGVAAGGGFCMALASDVIIASPKASFIASFINIGLSGGELGTTYFLPRLVGFARTAEILYTGRAVGAAEAERIGLVNRVVEEGELLNAAFETARLMLSKTPGGLRLTKEALVQNLNAPSVDAAVELENRNQSILIFSPDFRKAVEAFAKAKNPAP